MSRKFFDFITSSDQVVNNYLWEYGTAAFSIHLIKNTEGADELTLDLFENSICLLDTNVLIDIALETDEDHEAFTKQTVDEKIQELQQEIKRLKNVAPRSKER